MKSTRNINKSEKTGLTHASNKKSPGIETDIKRESEAVDPKCL